MRIIQIIASTKLIRMIPLKSQDRINSGKIYHHNSKAPVYVNNDSFVIWYAKFNTLSDAVLLNRTRHD